MILYLCAELLISNSINQFMEQGKHLPDEKLEAMLNRLKVKSPNIKCPSGNKIDKLCVNLKCKSALRCDDKQCKNCGKAFHKVCGNITLQTMTEVINERTEGCRQFVMKIFEIEQKFIEGLRRSQMEFINRFGMGLTETKHCTLITNIFEKQKYQTVSGEDVQQLCWALQAESEGSGELDKAKIEKYSDKLQQLLKEYEQAKVSILTSASSVLKIDSNVLKLKGTVDKDVKYIEQKLNHPKQIKLLFRASEHSWSGPQFHKYCDNIEDTLVIARSEYGRTIAGYSHYTWNQTNGVVNDAGRRAFLLQLDLYEKMIPDSDNNLIYCYNTHGPLFGGDFPDFGMNDQCNINSSYGSFPTYYNRQAGDRYIRGKQSNRTFTGSESNSVKYTQYEVFQVVYK